MVRDIGDPCLSQSHIKVSRMLKPEKWQASFDGDGKVSGFQKALKLITLGGVDPSIRPEVWEFLLGCYAPGSTAEYRERLRIARRERYKDLIKQCQVMHSSIGTGSLAYVVGSKVMDMRTSSKDDGPREAKVESGEASVDNTNHLKSCYDSSNNYTDTSHACQKESSTDSADLFSVRRSADSAAYDSCFIPASGPCNCSSPYRGCEAHGSHHVTESYFDFPPLPVSDLFEQNGKFEKNNGACEAKPSTRQKLILEDDKMHSFQITNNADLIMESNGSPSNSISQPMNSETEMACPGSHEPELWSKHLNFKTEITNKLRVSDILDVPLDTTTSQGEAVNEERVSEWLWTLHRIVVDVVRTDSHLEFYEDTRNLARMSDILAVYAWVDPATGYCQGMSDLLSPFVVLFEDNADAFWCFEMLLRRMRDNFEMEGPTGVMKQLEELWHILELTDREMFKHLSHIGAESLHFAFRMLLVLFRRELSFSEALCMWEMMWAADFDEALVSTLEENCLEALVVKLPMESGVEMREENTENVGGYSNGGLQPKIGNVEGSISDNGGMKSTSPHPFCGLTRTFWSRNDHMQNCIVVSSTGNVNDELPVFCVAKELDGWLREAGLPKSSEVRGVIAPHAGYSYSGRAAAYAFGNIDPTNITRVFLLGPSHHYYTPKCALSTATIYKTPIGDLPIDLEVIEELKATGKFELMDIRVDEAEHSMEMHLPYLAKVFEGHPVKIVPILVGALNAEKEAMYGRLLAKYVDDPSNFFSVSSDFCHWGSRFNYMHYDKKHGAIHKSIEALDNMGMDIIETGDPDAFKKYLLEYDNTICGRHPISVFLHMLRNCSTKIKVKFLRYEQSSQCKTMRDSSVSYASAAAKVDT